MAETHSVLFPDVRQLPFNDLVRCRTSVNGPQLSSLNPSRLKRGSVSLTRAICKLSENVVTRPAPCSCSTRSKPAWDEPELFRFEAEGIVPDVLILGRRSALVLRYRLSRFTATHANTCMIRYWGTSPRLVVIRFPALPRWRDCKSRARINSTSAPVLPVNSS